MGNEKSSRREGSRNANGSPTQTEKRGRRTFREIEERFVHRYDRIMRRGLHWRALRRLKHEHSLLLGIRIIRIFTIRSPVIAKSRLARRSRRSADDPSPRRPLHGLKQVQRLRRHRRNRYHVNSDPDVISVLFV